MTSRRSFLGGSAASLGLFAAGPLRALAAGDPSRVALVVGNDHYSQVPLGNAANDARAMARLLEAAGFRVDMRIDAGEATLAQAVNAFGQAIARPEVKLAFFYYAGHGVQVDWRNYLVPIDANVGSAADVKSRSLDLGTLLSALSRARDREYVIVLDACRDNPFGATWVPERKGLSQFDAPTNSLIAFSTAPGSVASDGAAGHGLYTENLVRELGVKGAKIEDALKRVRLNVRLASSGAQVPWESTSLEGDVFVFPAGTAPADPERHFEDELARWQKLKGSRHIEDWAAFVRDYPDGKFSEMAQARLAGMMAMREKMRSGSRSGSGNRGILEIGDGKPLPQFLRRPANPFSAGTYPLDRDFRVGDEATYAELDEGGQRKRTFSQKVTRVDDESQRVEYNGGTLVTDLLGNVIKNRFAEYDVPVQVNPAELQVGKKWWARFHVSRKSGHEADIVMRLKVVARERVVVPAGEFDAFRIEGWGRPQLPGMGRGDGPEPKGPRERVPMGGRQLPGTHLVIWEVPGLNFAVKQERTTRIAQRPPQTERLELVSLRQARYPA